MENKITVTADDFGLHHKANKAIVEKYLNSEIDQASLLTNMPGTAEAIKLAKKYKIRVGLHFNIIENRPISKPNKVPSLVDKNGFFNPTPILILKLTLRENF